MVKLFSFDNDSRLPRFGCLFTISKADKTVIEGHGGISKTLKISLPIVLSTKADPTVKNLEIDPTNSSECSRI